MATATATKPDHIQKINDSLDAITKNQETLAKQYAEIKEKAAQPVYPDGVDPRQLFHATTGPIGQDSAGYSIMKAAGFATGAIAAEHCKAEIDFSNRLKALYTSSGYRPTGNQSIFVPYSVRDLPTYMPEGQKLAAELKQKMYVGANRVDPDEANWLVQKGIVNKAFGTVSDVAGGTLVGFPTLGELVDLQRNREVFTRAGASEVSMPANARLAFPKQTNGATAYWVGEAAAITASDPATGILDLIGKKLGVLVKMNNELIRYASPTSEALVRNDMARVLALKADLGMLEGTGGTQIKGLITYPTAASWSTGVDSLITYTVASNKLHPQDAYKIVAKLPDELQDADGLKFIMRNELWGVAASRRADAVSAADEKGPFVYNLTRPNELRMPKMFGGYDVICSSQVSNTRGSGSQSYTLLGYFPDWVIARFGVMEFLASNTGDTPLQNDQTWLRGIQILDAGPRHSASFVFADAIDLS